MQGQIKTFQQIRQDLYEKIVDETVFVARASEGAVSMDWLMEQPIHVRKKYVDQFEKELKERQKKLHETKGKHK